ncbi:MAG: helix-turn-helix transcriptional regulator [Veillonellales bacterium]
MADLSPGRKLDRLIIESGIEVKSLAPQIGKSKYTIYKYISGERPIKDDLAKTLAELFSKILGRKIPEDYLLAKPNVNNLKAPVYQYKEDGSTTLYKDPIVEEISITTDTLPAGDYFYLHSDTNLAAYATAPKETYALCRTQDHIADGQTAVVMYKGKLFIRTVRWADGRALLYSTAPTDDVIISSPNDIKIVGKVARVELPL